MTKKPKIKKIGTYYMLMQKPSGKRWTPCPVENPFLYKTQRMAKKELISRYRKLIKVKIYENRK